ncbi:aspartate 1-decarboxylase autocleavage activator PanM [Pseudomonas sp. GD03860]|uniref:aspartate 1-decarboxylase autocleavage activator PanM n=1 Tax=Pseudomonas TaxID=286 RepID=UPI002363D665|nr:MULTISPECIES: aspartate 1-decarboxylase autocleavage activator PanM [Pseudomonas]MDD2059352.1 aspartate 1-decarboxylase autocleavage activator PanM [Pseudomonas putida]MDH0636701.1 aspartate 1-decarboxylase autocleavage activator PanM [Pseudomonas sp. GD03860]
MPIVVETLTEPSPQDLQDLARLYADAPTWMLASPEQALALVNAALADGSLIAARFNDRLLGAARLQRRDGTWHLSDLCVRSLTRRRGVGLRLVNEAQRLAREADAGLRLYSKQESAEMRALLAPLNLSLDLARL